jgi:hypothetical protein
LLITHETQPSSTTAWAWAAFWLQRNTNPNKFSLLPFPKGEGQDEGIYITTFWHWYNIGEAAYPQEQAVGWSDNKTLPNSGGDACGQ